MSQLQRAGYDVLYREFHGPHTIPLEISTEAMIEDIHEDRS